MEMDKRKKKDELQQGVLVLAMTAMFGILYGAVRACEAIEKA